MKKYLIILSLLIITLTGCDATDPAHVSSNITNDPLNVNVTEFDEDAELKVLFATGNITYQVPIMDANTRALAVMEYEHHKIHEGETFTVLEINDLGNMAVHDHLIVAPDTTSWAHLVWEIEHELETLIQFYRGTTYSKNGTLMSSFNRNGNSSNNATTLVYHTPTITDIGTLIGTIQQGDGKKAGGSDRESNEFVLKQNTAYLIRITNLTVDDNLIFLKLNWYEHTNRSP